MQPWVCTTDSTARKCTVTCMEDVRHLHHSSKNTASAPVSFLTASLLSTRDPQQVHVLHPCCKQGQRKLISHHSVLFHSKGEQKVGGRVPYEERRQWKMCGDWTSRQKALKGGVFSHLAQTWQDLNSKGKQTNKQTILFSRRILKFFHVITWKVLIQTEIFWSTKIWLMFLKLHLCFKVFTNIKM